jgi:PRTRC genetic system protein F
VGAEGQEAVLLSRRKLRELARAAANDWRGSLCGALADLDLALSQMGNTTLLQNAQWAEPAYSAATLAYEHTDYVGEVLDDHLSVPTTAATRRISSALSPLLRSKRLSSGNTPRYTTRSS